MKEKWRDAAHLAAGQRHKARDDPITEMVQHAIGWKARPNTASPEDLQHYFRKENRNQEFTGNPRNKDHWSENRHRGHHGDRNYRDKGYHRDRHRRDEHREHQGRQNEDRGTKGEEQSKPTGKRDSREGKESIPVACISLYCMDRAKGERIRSDLSKEIKDRFLATDDLDDVPSLSGDAEKKVYKVCSEIDVYVSIGRLAGN